MSVNLHLLAKQALALRELADAVLMQLADALAEPRAGAAATAETPLTREQVARRYPVFGGRRAAGDVPEGPAGASTGASTGAPDSAKEVTADAVR